MDKQMKRNKYCFGLGTVGRDGVYTLVSMYLITYLTEVVGLSNANLAAIGTLMVIFRVFDALNDPVMGNIIENTRSRWLPNKRNAYANKRRNKTDFGKHHY